MPNEVRLSWGNAQVEDSRLTVPLEGELPDGWKDSFERTVKLLGAGEWGEIKVKKDRVQVGEVTAGTEEKLRHHLESIVAQANAAEEARRREAEGEGGEDGGGRRGEPAGPDAEMTARFRAFAEADADEQPDADDS